MKISELIAHLECLKQEHGDLDVERTGFGGDRVDQRPPVLAHRAKLKGRETKARFAEWYAYSSSEDDRKGDPVCKL